MGGVLLMIVPMATAGFVAALARLETLVSTLLLAYLTFVSLTVGGVLALSPSREVSQEGLALVELPLLVAVVTAWLWRGHAGFPLTRARLARREVFRSPLAVAFLVLLAAVLGYQLVLAVTVPPDNWDSLTYHLARVAAWAQHGGYYWIPNAATDRMNVFQPLSEHEILFLFAASGSSRFFAIPQFLAELAVLLAVYGMARRIGFGAAVAACSAALLSTFSLVALESMTAQNDLVAASFPAVAACLILGGSSVELVLAGAALGLGLGTKLSTAFVWPALALLAWPIGRRAYLRILAGASVSFLLLGAWGYWLNLAHTGSVLGAGLETDVGVAPSLTTAPKTVLHVVYRLLDVSVISDRLIVRLAVVGAIAALLIGVQRSRRAGPLRAVLRACAVAIPLAAPLLVLAGAASLAYLTKAIHIPVKTESEAGFARRANEDLSAYGPVGAVMLLGTPVLAAGMYFARRVDVRYLALALALPLFLVLLGVDIAYNPFLARFLLVPVVLTAPLFGLVLQSRAATASLLVIASFAVVLTLEYDRTKPYRSVAGHPWHMTSVEALQYVFNPDVEEADADYERLVPRRACVGAVLGSDEPSYLLWGRDLKRQVFYLPSVAATSDAIVRGVSYVVISASDNAPVASQFRSLGWSVKPLGSYWLLATVPHPQAAGCT